jgi:hypothetical protein
MLVNPLNFFCFFTKLCSFLHSLRNDFFQKSKYENLKKQLLKYLNYLVEHQPRKIPLVIPWDP